ncbi:hypothetical protein [Curvivirga aplysinae]|uniref:hypothetical protein n=1 Tax=Curvivirga aplysinae TaxID=2529852 RepID=UPI0012BC7A6E|nr:hypothetical protein [Curvivirga aplysinae]MTI10180.1 hypothetical protein [Curvivirga aplysinae]
MTSLFERLLWAKSHLEPYQSQYAVVFEHDMDEPVAVMHPDPNWMACAIAGDILPPVEVYQQLEIVDGKVTNGHILHEEVIPAMTEEQAVEYLIQKDIPPHVWMDNTGNRPKFKICKRDQIPTNRNYRNAWSLAA